MAISNDKTKRKVNQYTLEGEFIKAHNSIAEATRAVGKKSYGKICECCQGKYTQVWGYKWEYDVNSMVEIDVEQFMAHLILRAENITDNTIFLDRQSLCEDIKAIANSKSILSWKKGK